MQAFAYRKHVSKHLGSRTNEKVDLLPDACCPPVWLPCKQCLALHCKSFDGLSKFAFGPCMALCTNLDAAKSAERCMLHRLIPYGERRQALYNLTHYVFFKDEPYMPGVSTAADPSAIKISHECLIESYPLQQILTICHMRV